MRFAVETWTFASIDEGHRKDRTILFNVPVINRVEAACIASMCALSMFPEAANKIIKHDWTEVYADENIFGERVEIVVVVKEKSDSIYALEYGIHNFS